MGLLGFEFLGGWLLRHSKPQRLLEVRVDDTLWRPGSGDTIIFAQRLSVSSSLW